MPTILSVGCKSEQSHDANSIGTYSRLESLRGELPVARILESVILASSSALPPSPPIRLAPWKLMLHSDGSVLSQRDSLLHETILVPACASRLDGATRGFRLPIDVPTRFPCLCLSGTHMHATLQVESALTASGTVGPREVDSLRHRAAVPSSVALSWLRDSPAPRTLLALDTLLVCHRGPLFGLLTLKVLSSPAQWLEAAAWPEGSHA